MMDIVAEVNCGRCGLLQYLHRILFLVSGLANGSRDGSRGSVKSMPGTLSVVCQYCALAHCTVVDNDSPMHPMNWHSWRSK
jgi:hypothetical protein